MTRASFEGYLIGLLATKKRLKFNLFSFYALMEN
jgi:hypothetical protein